MTAVTAAGSAGGVDSSELLSELASLRELVSNGLSSLNEQNLGLRQELDALKLQLKDGMTVTAL